MDLADLYLEFVLFCVIVLSFYSGYKKGFKRDEEVAEKDSPPE